MKTMKNLFLLALLFATVSVAYATNPQKVKLRLNLEAGKTYKIVQIATQDITQTIMGQEQKIHQETSTFYDYKVLSKNASGEMKIEVTYTRVKFKQDGPNGLTEYDSDDKTAEANPATQGHAALIGKQFTMLITPMGKVKELEGIDQMLSDMIDDMGVPDAQNQQLKETLKGQFGTEAMRANMEKSMALYPKKKVKVGDTWEVNTEMASPFAMVMNNSYKLVEIKNGLAKVQLTSTMKSAPNGAPMKTGEMKMTFKLDGSQSGVVFIDTQTGLTTKSDIDQDMKGDVSIDMGGQSMEFPMKIKGKVKQEVLK